MIRYGHLGLPKYQKVFHNILFPNNDITHNQTIKCNLAELLSGPEQNYFHFLIIKFQEVRVHSLPEKTIPNMILNISPSLSC